MGDRHYCGTGGAGTGDTERLDWGSGQVEGGPRGWSGTVRAVGALRDTTKKAIFTNDCDHFSFCIFHILFSSSLMELCKGQDLFFFCNFYYSSHLLHS